MRSFAISAKYNQVKDEMGGACSMNGEEEVCRLLVGKPEGKRH
jgi:hypothetical protein